MLQLNTHTNSSYNRRAPSQLSSACTPKSGWEMYISLQRQDYHNGWPQCLPTRDDTGLDVKETLAAWHVVHIAHFQPTVPSLSSDFSRSQVILNSQTRMLVFSNESHETWPFGIVFVVFWKREVTALPGVTIVNSFKYSPTHCLSVSKTTKEEECKNNCQLWIAKRQHHGVFHRLLAVLSLKDQFSYQNYLWMRLLQDIDATRGSKANAVFIGSS